MIKISAIFNMFAVFKNSIIFFLVTFCFSAHAFDVDGRWVIDFEETNKFNNTHSNMSALKKALIKCQSMNLTLIYNGSESSLLSKEHYCSFGEKEAKIEGFERSNKYQKLYEDENMVVLLNNADEKNSYIDIINRVHDGLIWIYYSGESPEYDEHLRYYYKRTAK